MWILYMVGCIKLVFLEFYILFMYMYIYIHHGSCM